MQTARERDWRSNDLSDEEIRSLAGDEVPPCARHDEGDLDLFFLDLAEDEDVAA